MALPFFCREARKRNKKIYALIENILDSEKYSASKSYCFLNLSGCSMENGLRGARCESGEINKKGFCNNLGKIWSFAKGGHKVQEWF